MVERMRAVSNAISAKYGVPFTVHFNASPGLAYCPSLRGLLYRVQEFQTLPSLLLIGSKKLARGKL